MKKPRATQSTVVSSVYCDEPGCGWSRRVKFADIPAWHRKPCPKCGRGEVVSDGDLVMYESTAPGLFAQGLAVCFGAQAFAPGAAGLLPVPAQQWVQTWVPCQKGGA